MRLLYGNFDFEHQLGSRPVQSLPPSLRRINNELAFALAAIAEAGDCVWAPEAADVDFGSHLAAAGLPEVQFVQREQAVPREAVLCPWGWSRIVEQWGSSRGFCTDHPDLEVVAVVNSRAFSSGLEREWNAGPHGAQVVRSLEEFRAAIACQTGRWVVKANYGMSARERCVGSGSTPSEAAVGWVRKQLASGEAVFLEPWLDRLAEYGIQFTIRRSGEPRREGITPLLTDSAGTYRGSRFAGAGDDCGEIPNAVLETVGRAASRIRQAGYFGPLGIDVMKYRTAEGATAWRPLQDINARLTMGRLALGLQRLVRPGECAAWLHLRWKGTAEQIRRRERQRASRLGGRVRAIRTSPVEIAGRRAARGAYLVAAPSPKALFAAEKSLADALEGPDAAD